VVDLLAKEVSKKSMLAVSKATGIGLAAIGRYLKGVGEPTTKTLERLADYFRVSVPWLRGDYVYNYEEERRICDFLNLSDEEQIERLVKEYGGDAKELKEAMVAVAAGVERYPELVQAFFQIPPEKMDNALGALYGVKLIQQHYFNAPPQPQRDNHPTARRN
jgi:transcriptional regulator with XRE-family HTH domain